MIAERVILVGVSRAGTHVARALASAGVALVGIVSRADVPWSGAPRTEVPRIAVEQWSSLLPTILLIAVGDDHVASTAESLAAAVSRSPLPENLLVMHLSGSLASTVLSPFADRGKETASLHPVRSFAGLATDDRGLTDVDCAIETADARTFERVRAMVLRAHGRVFSVRPEMKSRYHLGAVYASNAFTALFDQAVREFVLAGVSEAEAVPILAGLTAGTLANIARLGTGGALTGPVVRGDVSVLERHLRSLGDKDEIAFFVAMTRRTLALARRAHPDRSARYDLVERFLEGIA